MAKPIPTAIRLLLVKAVFERGLSRRAAAKLFNVSVASGVRCCRQWLERGTVEPLPMDGDRRSRFRKRDRGKVRRWLGKKPDTTVGEIRVRLASQSLEVSDTSIRRVLAGEGLSWKRKTGHACERQRGDVQELRQALEETLNAGEGGRKSFIDETSVFTTMMRPCGWSPVGERCPGSFPFGHGNTTTLIAELSPEGIVAPMTLDGPLTGALRLARAEQKLAPELRKGDSVFRDNASVHKIEGLGKVIEEAGANLIFLPPCSPDLNPIEKAFARIKACLRKIAARTKRKLNRAIASAINLAALKMQPTTMLPADTKMIQFDRFPL